MDRITNIMNKACDYRSTFDTYSYLWVEDRNQFMEQFLLYNHVLTPEETEALHTEEGVPQCPPTLDQFKEQVCTQCSADVLLTCTGCIRDTRCLGVLYVFITQMCCQFVCVISLLVTVEVCCQSSVVSVCEMC